MKPTLFRLLLLCACAVPGSAGAQLLPAPLPRLPAPVGEIVAAPLNQTLGTLRQVRIDQLLRQHRRELDTDRNGAPVVRSRIVALDPSPEAVSRALDAGFSVESDSGLSELDLHLVVLAAPEGMRTRSALSMLQRLDPSGRYDYDHIYLGADAAPTAAKVGSHALAAAEALAPGAAVRVGLVDGGVDASHRSLAGTDVHGWGCEGAAHPDAHGTAVASLLAGAPAAADRQRAGARSELFAADIYCGAPTGGAVTGLAQALAWLSRERVAVINLSLVGPPNALLERLVDSMLRRGHVLVAAVGNDGPAAPPLYPAAYAGVIGVTAIDARGRTLPEAARGPQVDFAAPGSGLDAARVGAGFKPVRGTSFAAPLVARRAAESIRAPASDSSVSVMAILEREATDAGAKGRDDRYGFGVLAAEEQARWSPR
ncbi:S8 family serine peptidase [Pseudoxanthomonas sacheonensis]|uniref:S8 family serine peptidase n=1 Tax=Pseudoxanthomonas sacheonensis TaxID=443615 RepID=UPI001FE7C548|nr:S8 family serine peptidase [Pseudoxanthomonas sacheonensis]